MPSFDFFCLAFLRARVQSKKKSLSSTWSKMLLTLHASFSIPFSLYRSFRLLWSRLFIYICIAFLFVPRFPFPYFPCGLWTQASERANERTNARARSAYTASRRCLVLCRSYLSVEFFAKVKDLSGGERAPPRRQER